MNTKGKIFFVILGCLLGGMMHKESLAIVDPKELAKKEIEVWKAYYKKDRVDMGENIAQMLKAQYEIERERDAQRVGQKFVVALTKFSSLPMNTTDIQYDEEVKPLLREAYQTLKEATHASWDADEVASADLAWWVARRRNSTSDPRIVGDKIAHLYGLLYGKKEEIVLKEAGYRRAEAALDRDLCQDEWKRQPDWDFLSYKLAKSYEQLYKN